MELPPLRERREDIVPLASFLLGRVGGRHGRALRFSPDALRAILDYPWPGNVRELENALEYAVTVAKGHTLVPEDLPPEVLMAPGAPERKSDVAGEAAAPSLPPAPAESQEPDEEPRIRAALEAHHWNRAQAAASLRMSRTTLWRKMRELGLR